MMKSAPPCILTINGGSSSIRFAVYEAAAEPRRRLHGKVERIGLRDTRLIVQDAAGGSGLHRRLAATGHRSAVAALLQWLESQPLFTAINAVGHRVVHGMSRAAPARVTPRLLAELRRTRPYDPEHLPREIEMMEAIRRRHPRLPQVACFDTAFHRTTPRIARLLPIPRSYAARGVQRYGFHGLSYAYLLEELGRLDPAAIRGRIILAHLGNGCSLAAVHHGASIDTSMGFTPTSGLMMGSRTGDLDPGLAYYLARTEGMTAAKFQRMVNHDSGLLGVSGTSSDMRDLLAREARDPRAAEAIALFCYQARKWIGAYAAALGGLDTLVFAGGIGENSPLIRERICQGLRFLGVNLQRMRNARNSTLISSNRGQVRVRVMRTDEELMIARIVSRMHRAT
jgi:acetate kinase